MAARTSTRARAALNDRTRQRVVLISALFLIVLLAGVLRFRDLGTRTFQADESISSLIAAQASAGGGYEYLPATRGPVAHVASAAAFRLFGDGDATARLMPALVGVLLVALPFMFRRELGRAGAIAAALGLAVSPTMLYYSRFAGPDIYLAFFSLMLAVVVWRYLATANRAYLYALSLVLAMMFVSNEMALVIVPIFVAYLYYQTARDFLTQIDEAPDATLAPGGQTHYALLGVAADAAVKDIRRAYRTRVDAADTRDEREAIAHAYGVLTNEQRRESYDRKLARQALHAPTAGAPGRPGIGARIMLAATTGAVIATWPFTAAMRARIGLRRIPASADAMLVMALLALPFYGPLVQQLPFVGDRGFAGQQMVYVIGGTSQVPGGEIPIMLGTLGALFAVAMIAGMAWRWNVWVICFAFFYGTTLTFFTGFFTNSGGVWTGLWGTLDYWYRPDAEIQTAPPYYYAMMLPVYEFLPLAVAALGAIYVALRGGARDRIAMLAGASAVAAVTMLPASLPFAGAHRTEVALVVAGAAVLAMRLPDVTKFLAFWAVCAFFAFTAVSQKEPWLALHVALPLTLLAAKLTNDAIVAVGVPSVSLPHPRFALAMPPRLAQAGLAAAFAAVAVFSLRSGLLASWGHADLPQLDRTLAVRDAGDTPVELLQPVQTAPDVREIRDAIERAGLRSGEGRDIAVVLDTSNDFASAWLWYLRDYTNLRLEDLRRPFDAPAGAIVLADSRNRPSIAGIDTSLSLTYTQRWSFPQKRYSGLSARDIAGDLLSADAWSGWTAYMRDRGSIGELRTAEGVAVFPRELEAALPPGRMSDVLSTNVTPATTP